MRSTFTFFLLIYVYENSAWCLWKSEGGVRFLGIIKMEVTDSKGFIKYNYIFQRTKYSI